LGETVIVAYVFTTEQDTNVTDGGDPFLLALAKCGGCIGQLGLGLIAMSPEELALLTQALLGSLVNDECLQKKMTITPINMAKDNQK